MDRESEEYRFVIGEMMKRARQMAAQDENATEIDVLRRMLGQEKGASEEAIRSALEKNCEHQMKLLALGRARAAQDGVNYTLADCERELRQFAEMQGVPYETLLGDYTLESLLPGKYIQYYGEKIIAHYEKQYTVIVA